MDNEILYQERLTSKRTFILFLILTAFFLFLSILRLIAVGPDALAIVFLFFCAVFLFYTLNYRTLIIHLDKNALKLTFGIFTWKVALDNIDTCALDNLPALLRNGGAGIHFMLVRKRYRASFNFLEYPRLVIALRGKVGPVWEISFSTRQPDQIQQLIEYNND